MTAKSEITKTACPFCLYGCELSIKQMNQGDFIIRKIEYDHTSVLNQGRLCARGNSATNILDTKQRLTSPLLNNNNIDWPTAIKQISSKLKEFSPHEIAITFDINNTLEELLAIFSFAQELKVEAIARSYLEPEAFFSYSFDKVKYAELKDIEKSKVFLIIGDIFSKTPLLAKPILDVKYADRNHRIYYIDSVKTKITGFANKFLQVNPGTEPIILLGLIAMMRKSAKEVIGDKNIIAIKKILPLISEISGIAIQDIEEVAQSLATIPKGTIFASVDFAKTDNPWLFSTLSQLLSIVIPGDKKFCAPSLSSLPIGTTNMANITEQINQGKIKALINFGDIFPFNYPTLAPILNALKFFVTTTTFKNKLSIPNLTLAVPSIIEKSGTINTLWSKNTIKPLAHPINGSKSISEIIDLIMPASSVKHKPALIIKSDMNIDNIINQSINYIESLSVSEMVKPKPDKDIEYIILGEESAFGYRGIFDNENTIKINPLTAQKLQIKPGSQVNLTVAGKTKQFSPIISNYVLPTTISIPVNTFQNRIFFPPKIDKMSKEIIMPLTKGKLNK